MSDVNSDFPDILDNYANNDPDNKIKIFLRLSNIKYEETLKSHSLYSPDSLELCFASIFYNILSNYKMSELEFFLFFFYTTNTIINLLDFSEHPLFKKHNLQSYKISSYKFLFRRVTNLINMFINSLGASFVINQCCNIAFPPFSYLHLQMFDGLEFYKLYRYVYQDFNQTIIDNSSPSSSTNLQTFINLLKTEKFVFFQDLYDLIKTFKPVCPEEFFLNENNNNNNNDNDDEPSDGMFLTKKDNNNFDRFITFRTWEEVPTVKRKKKSQKQTHLEQSLELFNRKKRRNNSPKKPNNRNNKNSRFRDNNKRSR
eukprot:TRINITY_DN5004_c0_g1_i1.p1 TRINITY_DN5004_c0_g1~~TRINITY_DN5004_c0_g1_i1.p1  ORF type:complete len:344 (-),score=107.51 TRINITY_DN5004_c0_g1_i1:208-1146(-)